MFLSQSVAVGCTQASPEYAAAAAEADRLAEQLPKNHEPLKNASAYATPIRSQFLVLYRKFSVICAPPPPPPRGPFHPQRCLQP